MSPPRPDPAGPTLIWAQSTSGVIGRAGGIPWDVPEDMARFSALTRGHTVVMGRATWESLPARFRPLPRRSNVVLTRQTDYVATGATVIDDPARALAGEDVWVIGGAQVYALALPMAACCEVTEVEVDLRREDDDVPAPVLDGAWRASAGDWQTSSSGLRFRYLRFVRG